MKKKVWDITVKDNPNRVVMGENDDFYTTDTEAYLIFILGDTNFNPSSALLTLENRNDGSLKSEEVDVVHGKIEWEMPQRYIEHSGNWQGQLVYEDTKDGQPESYTSATFTFVVNAHIGDKKRPSLVEIENWEKFIREGTELIKAWEDLDALREENERQRKLAESERASNEDERIANEQARELAESNRATMYSEVTAGRTSTVTGDSYATVGNRLDEMETMTVIGNHKAYFEIKDGRPRLRLEEI